jgi:UDP-N-acetylglucosamine 2-epimerase (non-hydrolysing)
MGRVAGLRVGHVESGLRSFRLLHPFPEELTRLATFALCDHYFCPGPEAMANLARFDGVKVDLGGNTLYDALQEAIASRDAVDVPVPAVPYVVVTTHRFENIFVRRRLLQVLRLIAIVAERHRTLFILHPPTERVLRASGLYRTLESNPNVELHPRYDYFRFIRLVHGAEFVVSDGGSNQEETYYLGKPTLLLRSATERGEGLGETCVLSGYDEGVVRDFTAGYARYRRDPVRLAASPSDVLLDRIEEFA